MIKVPNQRGVVRRTKSFSSDRVAERVARSGRRFAGELADATATKERRRRGVPATECGRGGLHHFGEGSGERDLPNFPPCAGRLRFFILGYLPLERRHEFQQLFFSGGCLAELFLTNPQ